MKPRMVEFWKDVQTFEKVDGTTEDPRLIKGLVTVGSEDSDGEELEQVSAFKGLASWIERGGTPIAYMHDLGGSLGHALEVEGMRRLSKGWEPTTKLGDIEASKILASIGRDYGFGTAFFGRVEVNDVWAMLTQKAIGSWSIHIRGFQDGENDVTGAPRIVTERVIESSIVTVPAQLEAGAEVMAMLKHLGIKTACKDCSGRVDKGLDRLHGLTREQWATAVAHVKEHSQDEDPQLLALARSFAGLTEALTKG